MNFVLPGNEAIHLWTNLYMVAVSRHGTYLNCHSMDASTHWLQIGS